VTIFSKIKYLSLIIVLVCHYIRILFKDFDKVCQQLTGNVICLQQQNATNQLWRVCDVLIILYVCC
jgi:hypothetical protein